MCRHACSNVTLVAIVTLFCEIIIAFRVLTDDTVPRPRNFMNELWAKEEFCEKHKCGNELHALPFPRLRLTAEVCTHK